MSKKDLIFEGVGRDLLLICITCAQRWKGKTGGGGLDAMRIDMFLLGHTSRGEKKEGVFIERTEAGGRRCKGVECVFTTYLPKHTKPSEAKQSQGADTDTNREGYI